MKAQALTQSMVYLFLPLGIALSFVGLALLDKDHHELSDVFTLAIIPGFLIYFVPTIFICGIMFEKFTQELSPFKALLRALVLGILISFSTIMVMGFLIRVVFL